MCSDFRWCVAVFACSCMVCMCILLLAQVSSSHMLAQGAIAHSSARRQMDIQAEYPHKKRKHRYSSMRFNGRYHVPTEEQVKKRTTWVFSVIADLSPSELQHLSWCPVVDMGSKRWAEKLFMEWRAHVLWAQLEALQETKLLQGTSSYQVWTKPDAM